MRHLIEDQAQRGSRAYNRAMPVFYHLDDNVVTIRAEGPHTTDELREAWLASERDPAYPSPVSELRVCVDARESASLAKRSISDMRSTVAWFEERAGKTSRLCAFVARPGIQFGLARMMSTWIEFKGYRTFVTTDPAKAIAWLKEQS